jgi:hypothetical protein
MMMMSVQVCTLCASAETIGQATHLKLFHLQGISDPEILAAEKTKKKTKILQKGKRVFSARTPQHNRVLGIERERGPPTHSKGNSKSQTSGSAVRFVGK